MYWGRNNGPHFAVQNHTQLRKLEYFLIFIAPKCDTPYVQHPENGTCENVFLNFKFLGPICRSDTQ